MGKLADLWTELKNAKPDEKEAIQKKINSIEQWCIDNKFGGFESVTDWNKPRKKKVKNDFRSFTFEEPQFVSCGQFIKPSRDFCPRCHIDLVGLCLYNGQMLWKQ